jgi:hypothetical protein
MSFFKNVKHGAKVTVAVLAPIVFIVSTIAEAVFWFRLYYARVSWSRIIFNLSTYVHVNWLSLSVIGLGLTALILAVVKKTHLLTYGISELSLGLTGLVISLESIDFDKPIPVLPTLVAVYGISRGFTNIFDGVRDSKTKWIVDARDLFLSEEEYKKLHPDQTPAAV